MDVQYTNQSAKLIETRDPYELIATAGRVCYQSDGTGKDDVDFVRRAIKKQHYSILEHATLLFSHLPDFYERYVEECYTDNPFFPIKFTHGKGRTLISANARMVNEMYMHDGRNNNPIGVLSRLLYESLYATYPDLCYIEIPPYEHYKKCTVSLANNFNTDHTRELGYHKTLSFSLETDRGVMAELTRHRPIAFSVASTRYINFANDKRPMKHIVEPVFFKEGTTERDVFDKAMHDSMSQYRTLLSLGRKPEEARQVLPNSLWTEVFATATVAEWQHIVQLRSHKTAHPMIRDLMKHIVEEAPILDV